MTFSFTRARLSRWPTIALAALALLGGGAAPSARAQFGNTTIRMFSGPATGACSNIQVAVNLLNGDFYDCLAGGWHLITGGAPGATTFDLIGSGTNVSATMTVGTGATLTFSGSGINNASLIRGVAITGTPTLGQIPIASSGSAAAWGDPLVTPNFADNSAFTPGTTGVMNIGAWYSTSPTACTSGNACAPSLTSDRKLFTQAFQGTSPWVVSLTSTTITGTVAVTQSTSPWVVSGTVTTTPPSNASTNVAQWAGNTLGATSNYGTSPGAVAVPGVNAFITNTPAVTLASTTITGTVAVTQSTSPWVDNITQFGGTNLSTGTGASGAGIPRVTVANDSNILATQSGTWTDRVVGNAGGAFDAANNAAAPANVLVDGFEAQGSALGTSATAGNVRRGVVNLDGVLHVREGGPVIWSCNLTAIAATLTQCQAAPAAGTSLYITDILAQSNTTTAGTFTVRFGTGTNCATGTGNLFYTLGTAVLFLPANTAQPFQQSYHVPIKVAAANAICVLGVVTQTTNIQINGYTAP